jgi:hypothetical protein
MRMSKSQSGVVIFFVLLGCSSGSGGGGDSSPSSGAGGSGGQASSSAGSSSAAAGSGGSSQAGGSSSAGVSSSGGDKASAGSSASGGSAKGGTGGASTTTSAGGSAGKGGNAGGASSSAVTTGGSTGAGGSGAGQGGTSTQGGTAGGATGGAATGNKGGSAGGGTASGGTAGTSGTGTGVSTGPVKHRFLKSGCDSGSVAIVAADGSIEWEYKITDETADSWLLPNGNVVFSFKGGVRELTPDKATVWEYKAPANTEVQSCQPLENDQFLIGEAHSDGNSVLLEMGRDKKVTKTVNIKTTTTNAHDEFRQVRKTPAGTYLVTQQRTGGKAQEYDATGKLLRTFPCGRYVAIRLPDKNTLIACGDDHRIIEVDASDQIVWEVKESDIPNNKLLFVAGLQRLPNGNTVVANWSGHAGTPNQPQVFEITRDKKVVWEVKDAKLSLISSISILDSDALVDGVSLR